MQGFPDHVSIDVNVSMCQRLLLFCQFKVFMVLLPCARTTQRRLLFSDLFRVALKLETYNKRSVLGISYLFCFATPCCVLQRGSARGRFRLVCLSTLHIFLQDHFDVEEFEPLILQSSGQKKLKPYATPSISTQDRKSVV